MTVAKEPGHRGEHEVTVKTIAQGRSGVSGEPVVTNSCVSFRTRGCGCNGHPAFPAPSDFHRAKCSEQTRANERRDREAVSAAVRKIESELSSPATGSR